MTLDLTPYQAPLPYPAVRTVQPDPRVISTLMSGYCGVTSEMTTVLQYGYHSLRCKKQYEEISRAMRGIFYVETIHMELLGSCLCKLGVDPHYLWSLQEKKIWWQSSVVEYKSTPAEMLVADIQGEKGAVRYYLEGAATIQQPDIAALMARLAEDEKLHAQMLTDLYHRFFRRRK